MKDRLFVVPHTHYDAVVFKTRAEYLDMGLPIILRVLQCLKDDPRQRFALDQVCYVRPFLERYPEAEADFREMVDQGRLQIVCGMDSMADANIPSGESFVRQVCYGKGYYREKLGVDVKVGWAIDTFGLHPQMPQLLHRAGFDSLVFCRGVPSTQRTSEFIWQGIDGSQVLALWLPYSYVAFFGSPTNLPAFAEFARNRYEKIKVFSVTPNILACTGADLSDPELHLTGLAEEFNRKMQAPFEIVVATPDEFLRALRESLDTGYSLPIVQADFNPTFQGCYSSRIEIKQWNRELERLLTTLEKMDALATWLNLPVDHAAREQAWEPVLFNQFHDCLCGVQVDKVFADTMQSYAFSRRLGSDLLDARLTSLAAQVDTIGEGIPLIVFNTLGWLRSDVVEAEVAFAQTDVLSLGVVDAENLPVPVQILESERNAAGGYRRARILFVAKDVPALGHAVYRVVPNTETTLPTTIAAGSSEHTIGGMSTGPDMHFEMRADRGFIANEYYRLEFDLCTGAMTSLKVKPAEWELVREEMGNVIAKERDGGDFWTLNGVLKGANTPPVPRQHPAPKRGEAELSSDQIGDGLISRGPVMAEFAISHPLGQSWLGSRVRIYAGLPRIDFRTQIHNSEEWVRYRALFPTTILQGTITHEIPFGAIARPEMEYPAQNWIDYSAGQRGVALLNRGLPGNNVTDGVLMLSLMRASQLVLYGFGGGYEPGVGSTSGQEKDKRLTFDYALVPHEGTWQDARAYRAGLEFNNPLIAFKTVPHPGALPSRWGLVQISPAHVVLSALKPGKDGTLVIRVYEADGRAVSGAELRFAAALLSAEETNLLEDSLTPVAAQGNTIRFDLGSFAIKTFKVRLAGGE